MTTRYSDDFLIPNGLVRCAEQDKYGNIYFGGDFTALSVPRTSLAWYDPVTFELLERKNNIILKYPIPSPSGMGISNIKGIIPDLEDGYFIYGDFSHIDGHEIKGIAHFFNDWTLDTSWSLVFDVQAPYILEICLNPDGKMIIIGLFPHSSILNKTSICGETYDRLNRGFFPQDFAMIDIQTKSVVMNSNGVPINVITNSGMTDITLQNKPKRLAWEGTDYFYVVNVAEVVKYDINANPIYTVYTQSIPGIYLDGEDLYIYGAFNAVTINGVITSRKSLAVFNALDGSLKPQKNDYLRSIYYFQLIDDFIYISGPFISTVNFPASYYCRLNKSDLSLSLNEDLTAWGPTGLNSEIMDMNLYNDKIYLSGQFTSIEGQTKLNFAVIGLDGHLVQDVTIDIGVYLKRNGIPAVRGSYFVNEKLLIYGAFSVVKPVVERSRGFALDKFGNILSWNPGVDNRISSLQLDEENNIIYMGGTFTSPKSYFGAYDLTSNSFTNTDFGLNNYVRVVKNYNEKLYVGGYFTTAKGETRNNFAVFNSSGELQTENPNIQSSNTYVNTILLHNNHFYIGGTFNLIGATSVPGLVAFDQDWNFVSSWRPIDTPPNNLRVNYLGIDDSDPEYILICGYFKNLNGTLSNLIAAKTVETANSVLWDTNFAVNIEPPLSIATYGNYIAKIDNSLYFCSQIQQYNSTPPLYKPFLLRMSTRRQWQNDIYQDIYSDDYEFNYGATSTAPIYVTDGGFYKFFESKDSKYKYCIGAFFTCQKMDFAAIVRINSDYIAEHFIREYTNELTEGNSSTQTNFCGNNLNVIRDERTNKLTFAVCFDNKEDFSSSNDKLILGGTPLSLKKHKVYGTYALEVINNYVEKSSTMYLPINGNVFTCSVDGANRYFTIYDRTDDYDPSIERDTVLLGTNSNSYFMWRGMPMATTTDGTMILVEKTLDSSDVIDEIKELSFNGVPIQVYRIGNSWYLVVSDIR